MAITFVQASAVGGSYAAGSLALTIAAATSGNYLIAAIANRDGGGAASTVSSVTTTNVAWTRLGVGVNGSGNLEIWGGTVSGTGGTSLVITFSTSAGSAGVNASEFSGVVGFDTAAVGNSGTSTTATEVAYSVTGTGDLIYTACQFDFTATTLSSGPSGYTLLGSGASSSGTNIRARGAYLIGASVGAQSGTFTLGTSAAWSTVVVGLRATAVLITSSGHGLGVGLGRLSGTKIISSSGHGVGVGVGQGILVKYFGSMRGAGIGLGRCTATAIRVSKALGVGVSLAASHLSAVTRVGQAHGKGIGVGRGQIKKLTLPPPSSAAIRVGPWTRIPPSG
jgi:hypothetical protein